MDLSKSHPLSASVNFSFLVLLFSNFLFFREVVIIHNLFRSEEVNSKLETKLHRKFPFRCVGKINHIHKVNGWFCLIELRISKAKNNITKVVLEALVDKYKNQEISVFRIKMENLQSDKKKANVVREGKLKQKLV